MAVLRGDNTQSVTRRILPDDQSDPATVSVPTTAQGYSVVVRRCTAIRLNGRLPYSWLTDATRRGFHVSTFGNGGEPIDHFAGLYRVSGWIVCGCARRSLDGIPEYRWRGSGRLPLARDIRRYPCGGFAELTLAYQGAER